MRDEVLNGEIFYTLAEEKILIEALRRHNTVRLHGSPGYRPPAPEAATAPWLSSGSASLHLRPTMAPEATFADELKAPSAAQHAFSTRLIAGQLTFKIADKAVVHGSDTDRQKPSYIHARGKA